MSFVDIHILEGEARLVETRRGRIHFMLGDAYIDMPVPGSVHAPFREGDRLLVAVRRDITSESYAGLAFTRKEDRCPRAAGRWKEIATLMICVPAVLYLAVPPWNDSVGRALSGAGDLALMLAIFPPLAIYSCFRLVEIHRGREALEKHLSDATN